MGSQHCAGEYSPRSQGGSIEYGRPVMIDLAKPEPATRNDVLLAYEPLPFITDCSVLGFRVTLQSNDARLLKIARASWPAATSFDEATNIRLQLGVREGEEAECPLAPVLRAQGHLMTSVCDAENFITCDLKTGQAFGWINSSVLDYPEFVRYHLIDASMMTLLTTASFCPLHAACVSYGGRGILLHGCSGAGKSSLAYACARAGWTYTTDDASYMLRDSDELLVRGRCTQFRFRPSARELFPELANRSITPRAEGKPSIEVPSDELPGIATAPQAPIYSLVNLNRTSRPETFLTPLSTATVLACLEESLFPLPFVRGRQRMTLQRLAGVRAFTLHYRDLEPAIELLEALAEGRF